MNHHEDLKSIPSEEQQDIAFRSYLWKNLLRHLPQGKYPSKSDLFYFARLFLEKEDWGHKQTPNELVQIYYREKGKRTQETKERHKQYEEEKELRAEKAARQGDLFE